LKYNTHVLIHWLQLILTWKTSKVRDELSSETQASLIVQRAILPDNYACALLGYGLTKKSQRVRGG
jgi:hypothetical protein